MTRPTLNSEDARLIMERLAPLVEAELTELSLMSYKKAHFGVEIECAAPYSDLREATAAIKRDLQGKVPDIDLWLGKDDGSISPPSSIDIDKVAERPEEVLAAYVHQIPDIEQRVATMEKIKGDKEQWSTLPEAIAYLQQNFNVQDTESLTRVAEQRPACRLEFITPGPDTARARRGGLQYNTANLRHVKAVIDYMKKEHFLAGKKYGTGMHIHFSVEDKHYTIFNLVALSHIVYKEEDKIYSRFPDRSKDSGYATSIKGNFEQHCKPFLDSIAQAVKTGDQAGAQKAFYKLTKEHNITDLFDWGHSAGLNIGDSFSDPSRANNKTVEFRYACVALDSDVVVAWIKECAKFIGSMLDKQIDYKGMIITEETPGEKYVVQDRESGQTMVVRPSPN